MYHLSNYSTITLNLLAEPLIPYCGTPGYENHCLRLLVNNFPVKTSAKLKTIFLYCKFFDAGNKPLYKG